MNPKGKLHNRPALITGEEIVVGGGSSTGFIFETNPFAEGEKS